VTLRKCDARTRLQVPLKRKRARLIAKHDYDVELPRAPPRSVNTFASVAGRQSHLHVGRHAGV